MRSLFTPGLALVLVAAVLAAGCGGGGSSSVPRAGSAVASKTNYTVKIAIPTGATTTGSTTRRTPKYISASLASIVVQILGAQKQQLVQGNDYLNITATGSASNGDCMTSVAAITCTLSLSAAIGTGGNFTVVIATYDAQQTASCTPGGTPACSGNLLSITNLPQNIAPGQTLAVTLGGIPAYVQGLELVAGYIRGNGGALTFYGPGPQKVNFEFLDADRNVIIGSGGPTLTVSSSNSSVLTASVSSVPASGIYTVSFTPQTVSVGGLPVVQPTTVPLQFTASIPGTNLSASVSIPFTIAHSVMYVAAAAVTPPGTITIYAYFDGNSTPSWNVYDTGYGFVGLATDINGNLWAADAGNAKFAEWINPQPSPAPFENDPSPIPSPYYPRVLAFDISGNAFVGNCGACGSGPNTFDQFNAPNPQSSPNFSSSVFTYSNGPIPYSIAVDLNDSVYTGTYSGGVGYATSFQSGNNTGTTQKNNGGTPLYGVAIDPNTGYLWVTTTGGNAILINPATQTQVNSVNNAALSSALGIATDSLGNLYIPNFSASGVVELSPPSYSTPVTLASGISNAVSVATYPNSLIGQDSQIGVVPPQTPSPTPLPAPS